MLEVNQIYKSFDQHQAVNGLSFKIKQGEIYGLLGPNGAGKTTTIHQISGIMSPDQGQILIDGKPLYPNPSQHKQKLGIVPQEIALYNELSARKNLHFWGSLYGLNGKSLHQRADLLLDWVGLQERADDLIKHYSGGMKRRINIAAALMHNPELILMDEPTVGIDPQSRNHIYSMLQDLHKQGKTILYTTHYMNEVEMLCDKIGIIDHGQLIGEGTLEELIHQHGQKTALRFVVDQIPDGYSLPEHLLHQIEVDLQTIVVYSNKPQQDIGLVIQHLHESNLQIQHVDLQRDNLESVFLHLTGKSLRDN